MLQDNINKYSQSLHTKSHIAIPRKQFKNLTKRKKNVIFTDWINLHKLISTVNYIPVRPQQAFCRRCKANSEHTCSAKDMGS